MPSIIGNSTILGLTLSFTGPTGFDGPTGPRGPIGPSGLTLGPTGSTGIFIQDVISDLQNNTITLFLSDGRVIGPMRGFTGPTVNIKDSRGVSSAFNTDYKGFIIGVCGGYTFEFRGICGDGNIVFPSLSNDGTEIVLSIGTITGGVSYGNTASDFLVYSTPEGTVSTTKISVNDQTWAKSETNIDFLADQFAFGQNLSLGFTTSQIGFAGAKSPVQVFADFTETFLPIPSIGRTQTLPPGTPLPEGISGTDSGGYILDLNKSSAFKLSTPIGITAFHISDEYKKSWVESGGENTVTNSWLLFVDGSDVWNLPSNLIFSGTTGGLGSFGFCDGMNILRVQSDYKNNIYYGTFVDRCFGAVPPSVLRYPDIGSCCVTSPASCVDYVTQDHCQRIIGGVFNHLETCKESCNIGSCCLNGVCRDNVSKEVCEHYLGVFDATTSCFEGDGSPCVGGVKTYTLNKQNTSEPSSMLSSASTSIPQKIGEILVLTNDPATTLSMPSFVTDSEGTNHGLLSFRGTSSTFGTDIDGNGDAVINSTSVLLGVTFGIYFNNSANSIEDRSYPITSLPISLKDSSGVEQASVTFNVKPAFAASCGGIPTAVRIRTAFTLERFCHDCYFTDTEADTIDYYPVQQQSGTFDYCYDTATGNRTILCASSTDVDHIDTCSATDAAVDPDLPNFCVHFDHEFTARTRGMSCAPCLNAAEDGCDCGNDPCCCGTCFKPEMDSASPNYGRCVFVGCTEDPFACDGFTDDQGNPMAVGTLFPDAEVCSGGALAGRDATVLRKSGRRPQDLTPVCRGAIDVEYDDNGTTIIPDPYWFTPNFYPSQDALETQLYFAGITTASGISAEISWIKSQLENIVDSGNSKKLYFTPENENKNIILTPALGITCCNFEEYDTSYTNEVLIPLDYTPPTSDGGTDFEVKYIVVNGVSTTDVLQRCYEVRGPWYDIYGRKIENPGCKQGCFTHYGVNSEALFLRCIFIKNSNQLSAQHIPCIVKPLKFAVDCSGVGSTPVQVHFTSESACPNGGYHRYDVGWPLDGLQPITELLPANATDIGDKKFAKIVSTRTSCGATGFKQWNTPRPQGWWKTLTGECATIYPECNIRNFTDKLFGGDNTHPWTRRWLANANNSLCVNIGRWKGSTARHCTTQTINNLTRLPNMTTENSLIAMALFDEVIFKPRYCPCNDDTTSSNYCDTYRCQFLGDSCAPSVSQYIGAAVPETYQNCGIVGNFKKYSLLVEQGPDNFVGDKASYIPKLYEIDLINRTTTLTDHWLYYSTGRAESCGSPILITQDTDQGFVPNIRKIRSGSPIEIESISTLPLGSITVYWDGLTGPDENFFNRSTPIQKIVKIDPTKYQNDLGESEVYENLPVESPYTTWDIKDLGNGTFELIVTLHPETTIIPMTRNEWTICSWAYVLWTKKKPNAVNPPQSQTFIQSGDQGMVDPTLNYDTDFRGTFGPFKYDDFTTTDGFNDATWIKFELTTKLIITKDIKTVLPAGTDVQPEGDGVDDWRVIERTEYIKVLRPGVPNPQNVVGDDGVPPPNASRKLLTVDGASTCIEIDCVTFGDCFDLPDC